MIDFQSPENQLLWPRDLFLEELESVKDSNEEVALLLAEALTGNSLGDRIAADPGFDAALLVAEVDKRKDEFTAAKSRVYYRQRNGLATPSSEPQWGNAFTAWRTLVSELSADGWFDQAFGKDCPDDPRSEQPHQRASMELGFDVSWPPKFEHAGISGITDEDDKRQIEMFLSAVEWVGDHVARPRRVERIHHWDNCGKHFNKFSTMTGRRIYWWRANAILAQCQVPFAIESAGPDAGYVVERVDIARSDLARRAVTDVPTKTKDEIEQAISLFRRHGATRDDKRAATVSLCRILENLRPEMKMHLLTQDERDLFCIANRFDLRHKNANQKDDYGVEMLDWIFWIYLATIELMHALRRRPASQG